MQRLCEAFSRELSPMRKLAIVISTLVILVVLALLIVPHFINVNIYHQQIQTELQKRLGRPVSLGNMRLSLLPPAFRVDNAVISEDPRFGSQPFATVQDLSVKAKLLPLLHKQIQISALTLKRPHVELIRNAQGQWNFSTIGPPPPQQPQQPQQAQGAQALELDSLKITDGQVALTDEQKHQSRAVYDHIDLSLRNFAPDKQFGLSLAAHLPGKGTQTISLAGKAGPINRASMADTPLDGTLKLNQVSLDGVQKFLNTQSLANMAGVISGKASVKNENGAAASNGSVTIENAVVRGVQIGYPITLHYNVSDDLNTDMVHISKADIRLGSTPLNVSGTVNTRATPTEVDLKLDSKNVSLAEAARLASAFGVAFNPGMKVDGHVSTDISAKGAISKPVLNGAFNARDLSVSGGGLPAPVRTPALDLLLTPQEIRSAPFTATTGNTSVNGQFTLTNYTASAPSVDATLRTTNAQITDLLDIARAYGVSAVNGFKGSGLLTLDIHASGPVKNPNAMTFSGTGQIQNASLEPPNFRQPLKVKNANLSLGNNTAQLQNLAASLGQTNASGAITVRNFSAPDLQFNLSADKINIAELQQITGGGQQSGSNRPQRTAAFSLVPRAYAQKTASPSSAASPAILEKMTGNGTLSAGTVQNDQLVITNLRSNVTLNHGIITLTPLTAQLYGGEENGTIILDTHTTPMGVQVRSAMQNVQANPLISAVTSVKDTIYGLLASNTQVGFHAVPSNQIARTLNGNAAINLTNGRITKLDLLNELASVGKFAGVRKNAQAVTDFTSLSGHFLITNGVASTNDLRAQIAGGTFAANGNADLASQQLNMHLTAVLSKGFTQQIGGVGGLMQTALANNRGELVIPVIITGTFNNPRVEPDVEKVAQMRMQNLLPTSANPAAGSAGLLGGLLKGGNTGSAAGGLGDIVGAITGQQQQPQQQQRKGGQSAASPQNPQQQQQQQQTNPLNQALQGIMGGQKKQQKDQPQK
jgi:uncharacterized protein involved in outer membrane biogenesis